ncbi:hypothetical protein ABZ626_28115 [Streptomyces longispororuber]|uniref:hypothetical protein n=1 Tax=Streptomyces longispororuber TaxID=68230 RepID=UPI0034069CDF
MLDLLVTAVSSCLHHGVNSARVRGTYDLAGTLSRGISNICGGRPAIRMRQVAWLAFSKETGRIIRGADLGFASSVRDEFADQGGQRQGEDDGRGPEGDRDGLAI